VEKMVEFDACNADPFNVDAFNKGREIGLQSIHDGDTAAALRALSIFAQSLSKEHQDLPPGERRAIWQGDIRDAIDGLGCADPVHFRETVRSHLNEPNSRAAGLDHTRLTTVSSLVKEVCDILESPNSSSPAGNFLSVDYRVDQANNFIVARVEQLGVDARLAFVAQFNHRVAPAIEAKDGLRVTAGISDDDKHVWIAIRSPTDE
jgi:hypothetical protein